ncbi:MAG: response regulator, partial [Candidatus Edwardsbacteria bacterium]|nr:response regulator [Candidatus Edwardsbacteria bacterium]
FMARTINLLLVEDDLVDAKAITGMLKDSQTSHFDVAPADSFDAAAKAVRGGAYDVILLDLGLPDSFELETLTKMVPLAAGVPIIVISGLEDKEFAEKAKRQGAADYLFKEGISAGILEDAITRALEK